MDFFDPSYRADWTRRDGTGRRPTRILLEGGGQRAPYYCHNAAFAGVSGSINAWIEFCENNGVFCNAYSERLGLDPKLLRCDVDRRTLRGEWHREFIDHVARGQL